jgi:hypothetical protein
MTQVLVKTAPQMLGSYSYEVAPEDVKRFTSRPDIWWYTIPVDDVLDGNGWHKGGAWTVPVAEAAAALAPALKGPEQALWHLPPGTLTDEEENDDEEGRW